MKNILLVDDDAVIVEFYRRKLLQAGFHIEVAEDGVAAMKALHAARPDLVVLDLMLPKLGGVDVLKYIRSTPDLKSIPVIILSNYYMSEVREAAAGNGVYKALLKSSCTPGLLIDQINQLLSAEPAGTDTSLLLATWDRRRPPQSQPDVSPQPAAPPPSPAPAAMPAAAIAPRQPPEPDFQANVRADFLENATATLKTVRQLHDAFTQCADAKVRPFRLLDLYRKVHFLTSMAGMAGCPQVAQLCSALEALLLELHEKPNYINLSTLRTITASVEFLSRLFDRAASAPPETNPAPANILVVDDDALSNRVVVSALHHANMKAASADAPSKALKKLHDTRYDLFLLDISMPEMDGFELCAKLRAMPQYERTPVIFVTGHADFGNRLRSILSGGHDLIAKPILPIELAVKVVTHLLRTNLTRP